MKILQKAQFHKWNKWFAWHPVKTEDDEVLWLENVERRIFDCPDSNVRPSKWNIYKRIYENTK